MERQERNEDCALSREMACYQIASLESYVWSITSCISISTKHGILSCWDRLPSPSLDDAGSWQTSYGNARSTRKTSTCL